MKKLFIFFALISLIFAMPVFAQEAAQGKSVVLSKDETVNENYFAAGESVTVLGTVNGDAYIAGASLTVEGTINGDLLVAGGTIHINGNVTGDIRVAGGQLYFGGVTAGNITALGGSITIADDAKIGKGVVIAGGQVNVNAAIAEGLTIAGGNVTINDTVQGNVLAGVGNLILTPNAYIKGNLNYYSEDKASIQSEASIEGNIVFHKQTYNVNKKLSNKEVGKVVNASLWITALYGFIVSALLGSLVIKVAPRFIQQTSDTIHKHLLLSAGIGIIAVVMTPLLFFLLLFTIIGIPFALILITIWIMYLCFSHIFVSIYVGHTMAFKLNWKINAYMSLLLGLITLGIIGLIPLIGWLVSFFVTVTGVGALIMTKQSYYKALQKKDML